MSFLIGAEHPSYTIIGRRAPKRRRFRIPTAGEAALVVDQEVPDLLAAILRSKLRGRRFSAGFGAELVLIRGLFSRRLIARSALGHHLMRGECLVLCVIIALNPCICPVLKGIRKQRFTGVHD